MFVDIDTRRVVFIADGKDASTVAAFADDLKARGGDVSRIKEVCIDMSAAFITSRVGAKKDCGVGENLTEAEITFDKFHVMKLIGDAPIFFAPARGATMSGATKARAVRNSSARAISGSRTRTI